MSFLLLFYSVIPSCMLYGENTFMDDNGIPQFTVHRNYMWTAHGEKHEERSFLPALSNLEGQRSASVPKSNRKSKEKATEKTEKDKSNKDRGSLVSLFQPECQVRKKLRIWICWKCNIYAKYFLFCWSELLVLLVYLLCFSMPCFANFLLYTQKRLNCTCKGQVSSI